MRRKKLLNKNIYLTLFIVAIFTGLSFIFDQKVVQQENNIRNFDSQISDSKINLQKNLFLMNSIFYISKEISYLGQIKKNTIDDVQLRFNFFKDFIDNPESYEDMDPYRAGNKKGSLKLLDIHKEIFLSTIYNHNKKVKQVDEYINIFLSNDTFLEITEKLYKADKFYNKIKNINNFYISDDEINKIPFDNKTPYHLLYSDKDPFYIFYSDLRDRMHEFANVGDMMHAIAIDLVDIQKNNFKAYEKILINFSSEKNKKNFYILLSILFQISALTALMVLFKLIILQEKKWFKFFIFLLKIMLGS